jgi:AraC-like DNA-binding protein
LGLVNPDRAGLFAAADLPDPSHARLVRAERVEPSLQRTLDAIEAIPAYVTGARGDILAWNDGASAIYRCDAIPPDRRNSLLFLFGEPEVRKLVVNWEEMAARALDDYRRAMHGEDPWFNAIRDRLMSTSADFRRMWQSPPDLPARLPVKEFHKRGLGRLAFHPIDATVEGQEVRHLHLHTPVDDASAAQLARLMKGYRRRRATVVNARTLRVIQRVKQFLDENSAQDVRLESLAELVGLDKFHVLRLFSRDVGMPPHAYQVLLRIERVRWLLSQGMSPATAAIEAGFVDQSHMIRHFRRLEGTTPAAFRRSLGMAARSARA